MTDYAGIIVRSPRLSIPVTPDGRLLRRTVVFTASYQYFTAFCKASGIRTRLAGPGCVTWAGLGGWALAGLSYDGTDVVFYDWSECELTPLQRSWFDCWCRFSRDGMCYSRGEAAALRPDVQEAL